MDAVDLALVLALDGSASVNFTEFGLMADGLSKAFADKTIVAGLIGGERHASLCCVLLWSGTGARDVLIGWTRLGSAKDVAEFSAELADISRTVRPGTTALGEALAASLALLVKAPAQATRQVVNVAGDGSSNEGIDPAAVRDRMVRAGITINGLCILHEEPDLLAYYERNVIGGPGAFALTCPDYQAFNAAMRRKLVQEITNKPIAFRGNPPPGRA